MKRDPGELAWLIPLEDHAVEGAPAGSLISVLPGSTIGTGEFNGVPVRDGSASQVHARLVRLDRGWGVEDLETTAGTFVDEVRVGRSPAPLAPGATLRCGAVRLRFALTPEGPAEPLPLEEQLRARPDDEALWTAAADRWLEQGLRLGDRVVARSTGFPGGDTLLSAAVRSLGLEVEWRMGFVRRAFIRSACVRAGLSPEVVLAALLTHPLSRFLEQLSLDGLRLFDLLERRGFEALLHRWLPPGASNLEVGVAVLGAEGELQQLALARPALRQRYWLHGTMRLEPGGEISPVFGGQLDCQGLVRCAFELQRGGTHALTVLDDVPVVIRGNGGELRGGKGTRWFPGEELEVRERRLRFTEHTQTLLVRSG